MEIPAGVSFFYANNEPKSALARDLGDCRDNKGKLAKRVFTCYNRNSGEFPITQKVLTCQCCALARRCRSSQVAARGAFHVLSEVEDMNCRPEDMLLYAVTDRAWLNGETLESQVEKALKGGATFVQLREKELDEEMFLEEAKKIKKLCAEYHVPFVINDNVDIALKVDADGVHVGQSDMEAGKVREKLGPDKIIGVSCKTVEQALLAKKHGADYLGVGAMYPTGTKKDATAVTPEALSAICQAVDIPVVAIGGINKDRLEPLKGTGVDGVAVVSAIFAAEDIEKATRELKEAVREIL